MLPFRDKIEDMNLECYCYCNHEMSDEIYSSFNSGWHHASVSGCPSARCFPHPPHEPRATVRDPGDANVEQGPTPKWKSVPRWAGKFVGNRCDKKLAIFLKIQNPNKPKPKPDVSDQSIARPQLRQESDN